MYDTGIAAISDHWVDVLVGALIAGLGYFVSDRFRAMDARHARAEDKIERLGEEIADCRERIARLELFHDNVSRSGENS